MKTFSTYLAEDTGSVVDRFQNFAGQQIVVGRNVIQGFPVDIQADFENGLTMTAVDADAAGGLFNLLQASGFVVQRVGTLDLVVR